MAVNEIHVGDIGTIFELTLMDDTVVVDVSSAVAIGTKQIHFVRPDGTASTEEASFTTDGTDGKIQFITPDVNFLDQAGGWKIQGKVTLVTGTWSSDISSFKVYKNLV
jgi:hypothetical protein